jgi:hypothetical protein
VSKTFTLSSLPGIKKTVIPLGFHEEKITKRCLFAVSGNQCSGLPSILLGAGIFFNSLAPHKVIQYYFYQKTSILVCCVYVI